MNQELDRIIRRFGGADRETKLQTLLSYSRRLSQLPADQERARQAGEGQVHECQTPVYLRLVTEGGTTTLHAHAPPESPTVRGFLSLLKHAVDGSPIESVAQMPEDLLDRLGLAPILGMTRSQGLNAILGRVRSSARELAEVS